MTHKRGRAALVEMDRSKFLVELKLAEVKTLGRSIWPGK
jgi:hypothetical protein